jgi:uncharacterized membrane protein
MTTETESVDVAVPVRTAYNQWTQFEQFPRFMKRVKEVRQIGDTMTHWTVEINGVHREFDAQIVEQQPDRCVAWASTTGTRQRGMVTFEQLDETHTRVTAAMDMDPEGLAENVAAKTGMVGHHVKQDLENFKDYIENRGMADGAWRGTVESGQVTRSDDGLADRGAYPPEMPARGTAARPSDMPGARPLE